MAFYAKVRKAGGMVIGTTVLEPVQVNSAPWNLPNADPFLFELTEAEYTPTLPQNGGLWHDGATAVLSRFRIVGQQFMPNPDSRPVLTFTPSEVKAEVGETVSVQVVLVGAGNGMRELRMNGLPTRLDFTNNKAVIEVDTSLPGVFDVRSILEFRTAADLQVTIYSRKLGREV